MKNEKPCSSEPIYLESHDRLVGHGSEKVLEKEFQLLCHSYAKLYKMSRTFLDKCSKNKVTSYISLCLCNLSL